jgi:hypothetical protein
MPPTKTQNHELVNNLMGLLMAYRPVFGQARVYWRVVGLLMGEVFAFGRHTVTQVLLTLGVQTEDWSAWYRLFSRGRFREERMAEVLFGQTLAHVGSEDLYVVGGDGMQVPRSSRTMEGTSWLPCPRTPVFRRGIHRAQRFFHGSWLLPAENGYSRALPLRFLPAFPAKAVQQVYAACKEWEAAVQFLGWVRQQLDGQGRQGQELLGVFDGSYETVDFWRMLPERVTALVRTAKNRCLHCLPPPQTGRGRRRKYGERAPAPQAWLSERRGWQTVTLTIRGVPRRLVYRLEGPFLRPGAPDRPLFLLVVRGQNWSRHGRQHRRRPAFYLINAVQRDDQWVLPLPTETLLFWAWQRWELEVTHRELKSTFGLGEKQCWNAHAAVTSVQWSAWVYALLLLAGYRSWGLCRGPAVPSPWWHGAPRWSFNTLWRGFRAALWGDPQFYALWPVSPGTWYKKETCLSALANAIHASARL